jgi:hypothetical protein
MSQPGGVIMATSLRPSLAALVTLAATTMLFSACNGVVADTAAPPSLASDGTFWAVRLSDRAVNLSVAAPTNTMQITATPVDVEGHPLVGVTAHPTFQSLGGEVTVSPTGLITGVAPVTGLRVAARLTVGNVTRIDTVIVNVTSTAPTSIPAVLSIAPIAPDSAKWSFNLIDKSIIPRDEHGDPLAGLAVAYTASNDAVAFMNPGTNFDPVFGVIHVGLFHAVAPGTTRVAASTYAYGVRLSDTVTYTVGWPTFQLINVTTRLVPGGTGTETAFGLPGITIGVGGQVAFSTALLSDTAHIAVEPSPGGIPPFCTRAPAALPPQSVLATICLFPGGAGTYVYRALQGSASGTITVKAGSP